jgi:hypothetical protein
VRTTMLLLHSCSLQSAVHVRVVLADIRLYRFRSEESISDQLVCRLAAEDARLICGIKRRLTGRTRRLRR